MFSGLLILPLVISSFPSETLNIWFLFFSITGMSEMITLGLNSTLVRYISYTYEGIAHRDFSSIKKKIALVM